MNLARVGRDNKHQVLKYIFDNVTRQLKTSSLKHCPNIEVMYLILALRKLGREYMIPEGVLAGYFGFKRNEDGEGYFASSEVDYFATTVCLCYITSKQKYAELRSALEEKILQNIEIRSAYAQNDAELIMTYFDVACCPYVSSTLKMKIAGIFGHSVFQLWSLQASSPFWFTDWRGFDLSIALDKKSTREVY